MNRTLGTIQRQADDFATLLAEDWCVLIEDELVTWGPASWQRSWIERIELGDRATLELWREEIAGPDLTWLAAGPGYPVRPW